MTTTNARTAAARTPRPFLRSPRRVALAALGLMCVALGAIGIFVPGLPTTIFLIVASYLFTRSCPVLEERLLRTRLFAPYARYLDGSCPMPRAVRVRAIAMMWSAVALSFALLGATGTLTRWCAVGMIAAAVIGTVVVWRIRPERGDDPPAELPGSSAAPARSSRQ